MNQKPDTVHSIVLASVLEILREFRYSSDHSPLMDQEDDDHQIRPLERWRQHERCADDRDGNMGIFDTKQQRLYTKHNIKYPVRSVSWQNKMVLLARPSELSNFVGHYQLYYIIPWTWCALISVYVCHNEEARLKVSIHLQT